MNRMASSALCTMECPLSSPTFLACGGLSLAFANAEDVDVLGVSLLSGAHMTIFPRVLELLEEADAEADRLAEPPPVEVVLGRVQVLVDVDRAQVARLEGEEW